MRARPVLLIATLWIAVPAAAQSYDVGAKVVPGGGAGAMTGGVYSLGASAGQPDAGVVVGGAYTLNGGFWPMIGLCPAPAGIPAIAMTGPDTIAWPAVAGASHYDVVAGDLGLLKSTGGDLASAGLSCVANGTTATAVAFASVPAPGQGYFILVRANACAAGTWDSGGPMQSGSRDAEIAASGVCP